jgi:hypothetical protein
MAVPNWRIDRLSFAYALSRNMTEPLLKQPERPSTVERKV